MTSAVAAIEIGGSHSCAITTSGSAKCWGENTYGQLGDGTTANKLTAVVVTGLTSGIATISAGGSVAPTSYLACALTTAGKVKCWGSNGSGQLGDGTTTQRTIPIDVLGLASGIAAISAGSNHICSLTTSGGVKCWVRNTLGQIGDSYDTTTPRTVVAP
jgi:alpha-tubulin suppressor-like RCC1 family protein